MEFEKPLQDRQQWSIGEACSMSKVLELLSTKTTFQVVRELFFGTTRFDDFVERPRDVHLAVGGLDGAAGKDELARHELVALVALAHQHAETARAVAKDKRRGVARTHRLFRR